MISILLQKVDKARFPVRHVCCTNYTADPVKHF